VVGYDVFCFTGISKFLMEKLFVAGDWWNIHGGTWVWCCSDHWE
jgi:hypothetical protein